MQAISVGEVVIGAGTLGLIAGPCVIESLELCQRVAEHMTRVCQRLCVPYIFKASFDKANRTAHESFRGQGLEAGLEVLARIRREFGVPATTDIHESWQAEPVAQAVDLLQIPAFLCRQNRIPAARGIH
jgi:3-deoxy-D-manno-octulosonic acid (KDO) 8-phosphate synthase